MRYTHGKHSFISLFVSKALEGKRTASSFFAVDSALFFLQTTEIP